MCDHRRVPVYDYSPAGNHDHSPRVEKGFSSETALRKRHRFPSGALEQDPVLRLCCADLCTIRGPRPDEFARMYEPGALPIPPNFLPEHPFDNGELAIRDEELAPKPLTESVLQAPPGKLLRHDQPP